MSETLVNPDLAWALLFIDVGRHKYPKLRYVAGAFKGGEWSLQHSYFAPDQIAFVNKKDNEGFDTCWSIKQPFEDAVFDPVPWRMRQEFETAARVEIRVVRPFKVCRFCKDELFTGVFESSERILDNIPEALRISRFGIDVFEYKNRPVEAIRRAVDDFVLPISSASPIIFGVCPYCLANPDERLRRRKSSLICDLESSHVIRSLQYRGGLKIARKFDSFKRIMRLREKWDERCENPIKSGFLAAQRQWRKKREASLVRAHVPRRKNNKINFFAMVDAVGKLGKIQNQN